jgi:hypothetical protein
MGVLLINFACFGLFVAFLVRVINLLGFLPHKSALKAVRVFQSLAAVDRCTVLHPAAQWH